jgi:hypothetical protein
LLDGEAGFGTLSIALVAASVSFTPIPGLSQTFLVPADSVLYISTDGGVQTTSLATSGVSVVDIAVFVDGVQLPAGAIKRVVVANTGGMVATVANWSFALPVDLAPGNHTVDVRARFTGGNASAVVSGDSNSVLQGKVNIVVIKQ